MENSTNIQRSKFIQDLTDNGIPVILTVPGHPSNFISLINNQNSAVTVLLYTNKANNYYLLYNKSSIADSPDNKQYNADDVENVIGSITHVLEQIMNKLGMTIDIRHVLHLKREFDCDIPNASHFDPCDEEGPGITELVIPKIMAYIAKQEVSMVVMDFLSCLVGGGKQDTKIVVYGNNGIGKANKSGFRFSMMPPTGSISSLWEGNRDCLLSNEAVMNLFIRWLMGGKAPGQKEIELINNIYENLSFTNINESSYLNCEGQLKNSEEKKNENITDCEDEYISDFDITPESTITKDQTDSQISDISKKLMDLSDKYNAIKINYNNLIQENHRLIINIDQLNRVIDEEKRATYEIASAFNKLAELSAINDHDTNIKSQNIFLYEKKYKRRELYYQSTIGILSIVSLGALTGWVLNKNN